MPCGGQRRTDGQTPTAVQFLSLGGRGQQRHGSPEGWSRTGHWKGPSSLPENHVFKRSHCCLWDTWVETGAVLPASRPRCGHMALWQLRGLRGNLWKLLVAVWNQGWLRGRHLGWVQCSDAAVSEILTFHRGLTFSLAFLCIPFGLQIILLVLSQRVGIPKR